MTDFNMADPPTSVTNPQATPPSTEYPRHLHRFHAAPTDDAPLSETGLVVAWKGKKPIYNEYLIVTSDAEKAAALKDGWALEPVVTDPHAAKAVAAEKPAATKKAKKGPAPVDDIAPVVEPPAAIEPAAKPAKAKKSKKGT